MNINECKNLAYKLLKENNLNDINVKFIDSGRLLGQAHYSKKLLKLSLSFVELNSINIVKDIILHEIAHFLTIKEYYETKLAYENYEIDFIPYEYFRSHGKVFKKYCRKLNCVSTAFIKDHENIKTKKPNTYIAVCPICKLEHIKERYRKPVNRICLCYTKIDNYTSNDKINCRLNFIKKES